jgi:copper(I)-binding protein
LAVSAVPPLPTGSVQGQITLKTSWTNTPVIPVTVVVNAQPPVMVIPAYVTLQPGPLPNAVTNSIAIQNNSTNLLKLSDPAVNVANVQVQIKETQPGRSFAAMLEFPKGFQVPPGQQVEFSAKTSHPKVPLVKVPVMQLPRQPMPVLPTPPAPVTAAAPSVPPAPVVVPPTPVKPAPSAAVNPAPVRKVRTTIPPPPELPPEPPDPPIRSK